MQTLANVLWSMSYSAAKLLREGHHHRGPEEDCNLLQAAHRRKRGNHVRLQVPHRGEQNPLFVWDGELQRNTQLKPRPSTHPMPISHVALWVTTALTCLCFLQLMDMTHPHRVSIATTFPFISFPPHRSHGALIGF